MMARAVAFALLAVLIAPPAMAAPPVATLESTRVEASGAATIGSLAGLEMLGGPGHLGLSAASVEAVLEQESAHTYLNETPQGGGYQDQGPQNASYADVRDGRGTLRPRHEVYALPLPGSPAPQVRPGATCVGLEESQRAEVRPTRDKMHAQGPIGRHAERAVTRDALAWDASSCRVTAWVVEGSFLLTLWEGDLSFDHAGGSAAYTTGAEYPPNVTPPEVNPGVSVEGNRTNRLLYLAVHEGRLEVGGAATVFLGNADVQADTLVLRGATGSVSALDGAPLVDDDVELRGRLDARVTRSGQVLAVEVTGTLEGGTVGGYSLVVASGGGSNPKTWMAALMLLPLVAGGGAAAWRRRPARALARLGALALAGRHEAVAKGTRRLRRTADLSGEATALGMEALARSGRPGAALDLARRLPPMEAALAKAYIHAVSGDVPSCVRALRACATLDPGWLRAALRDPVFAAAARDPALSRWTGPQGADP